MRRLTKVLSVLLVLLAAAACSNREQLPLQEGFLTVSLSPDIETVPMVKGQAGAPVQTFSLEVTPKGGGQSVVVEDYRTLAGSPLRLVAGNYTVRAFSGTQSATAWNLPSYEGTTDIRIKPDQVNTAVIDVSLVTTMVTVSFEENTADFFSDYQVTVATENSEALVFNNRTGSVRDTAYFRASALDWELRMVNTAGGTYHLGPVKIEHVQPRQHYQLHFSIEEYTKNAGGGVVRLSVDDSTVTREYQLCLDFDNDGLPTITASFEITSDISIPKGNETSKQIYALAPKGMKSLVLSHSSSELLAAGLPQATELVDGDLSALNAAGVSVSAVNYGDQACTLEMSGLLSCLDLGTYPMTLTIVDTKDHYCQIPFHFTIASPVEAEAVSAKPWAEFAILKGKWYTATRPAGLRVQYRKASETAWTDYSGTLVANDAAATFSTELYGLEASTAYVFRVITDMDQDTREVSFTTVGTQSIPNLSFDDWYQDGNAWYPGADAASRIWDTANGGTASFGCVPTTPETSDVVAGKAARLESTTVTVVVITKFAAGNIYIGDFVGVSGVGAELDWGYPYSARPMALHGYYKYMPKAIDNVDDPYKDKKGEMDSCSIKMYLLDWSAKFRINTSKKVFLQDDDPSIIAMCDFTSNVTNSGYVEFTLPLEYRDSRIPSYVVVVGAASRLGDYFTGGKGSTLLLDEFSLIFDAGQLTEEQRSLVGYRNLQ
ncbi:MAG: PCMD domain-containing protein [Bacteroidales bacterium]|nr:PCMD domain-containing protein [Bacteroidales bacterium]